MRNPWTEQELELLRGYSRGELSLACVAERTGRTLQAVASRAHKVGLCKRVWNKKIPDDILYKVGALYEEQRTMQEVQNLMGLSYHQVRWCLRKLNIAVDRRLAAKVATQDQRRDLTPDEIQALSHLWGQGVALDGIALEIGCCRQVVRRYVSEQGWTRPWDMLQGSLRQRKFFSDVQRNRMLFSYINGLDGVDSVARQFNTSKATLRRVLKGMGVNLSAESQRKHSALLRNAFRIGIRSISPRVGRGIRSYFQAPLQGTVLLRSQDEARRARELNSTGKAWFYEISRFLLQSGETYLPDFWETDLPVQEVEKRLPPNPTRQDLRDFLQSVPCRIVDVKGWWGPQNSSWDKIHRFQQEYPSIDFHLLINDKKGGWKWE